jgi:Ca-activated chloride channel homolog
MELLNRKNLLLAGAIAALAFICFFALRQTGKTDDWKYSYAAPTEYLMYGAIIIGVLILCWLVISIYLIASGSPLRESNKVRTNPKRIAGMIALLGPILLMIAAFGIIFSSFSGLIDPAWMLAIPSLLLAYVIFGISYSIRSHVKIAILPILIVPVIIIVAVMGSLLFSGQFGGWSASAPMNAQFKSAMASGIQSKVAYEMSDSLGFSVGGAKDINNFRKNIENNYLPLSTDITYEGLFYDYYFDTGEQKACNHLFCPSYTSAISKDPFSNQEEYYLSVGLNSNIKESDFARKKLNLVVVQDISGSMGSSFVSYYYDQFGNRQLMENASDSDYKKSKIRVASESVAALLDHLNADDRFGMVLYDEQAYLAKPLSKVGETDMEAIKAHILEIEARGSTNLEAGMKEGTGLFDDYLDVDSAEYENRIIFLTDAMPNTGDIGEDQLFGLAKKNAENKIYITFIGIGVDFNTELIDYITKIRGANYYSVHSASEFKNRMDTEFEFMVTPLVFNLSLVLDAPGYKIEKVYGSPEADEATGEIMKVNTLFPSKQESGETKGGIVILKLRKISDNNNLKLKVSYEDRSGTVGGDESAFQFSQRNTDYYDNSGIRKGILLSRYANLMKDWINDERKNNQTVEPLANKLDGIALPPEDIVQLGRWERQSMPLKVSAHYQEMFREFKPYFESELISVGDSSLSKEVSILDKLGAYPN